MRQLSLSAALLAAALAAPGPALAEGEEAGEFDYYVLALSWSSSFCTLEGDARREDQCDARHDHSFTLHGLWPQYESGWPSYCHTPERDPARRETAAMEDIMGSAGLAWYQWKKHGRCSGLPGADYLATSRAAYEAVTIPPVFARLNRDVALPASVVEDAFLEANPGLAPQAITITCEAGMIREARICLNRDLEFRACGADVARDCRMPNALMEAVR